MSETIPFPGSKRRPRSKRRRHSLKPDAYGDLNELLIRNRNQTFLISVGAIRSPALGLVCGDLLVVDPTERPLAGDLVVVDAPEGAYVERFERVNSFEASIFGVVLHLVRTLKGFNESAWRDKPGASGAKR